MASKFQSGMPLGQSNLPGFSRVGKQDAVSGFTTTYPSGHVYEDTAGNAWYIWVDTNGAPRVTDAATAEAAGFNWLTGGTKISGT